MSCVWYAYYGPCRATVRWPHLEDYHHKMTVRAMYCIIRKLKKDTLPRDGQGVKITSLHPQCSCTLLTCGQLSYLSIHSHWQWVRTADERPCQMQTPQQALSGMSLLGMLYQWSSGHCSNWDRKLPFYYPSPTLGVQPQNVQLLWLPVPQRSLADEFCALPTQRGLGTSDLLLRLTVKAHGHFNSPSILLWLGIVLLPQNIVKKHFCPVLEIWAFPHQRSEIEEERKFGNTVV